MYACFIHFLHTVDSVECVNRWPEYFLDRVKGIRVLWLPYDFTN